MIRWCAAIFSFKMSRLYYTRFFGLDYFSARFENKQRYFLPLVIFSAINFMITHVPILIIDLVSIIFFSWGSQYYIECIESFLIITIMLLLTVIEFRTGKMLDYDPLEWKDEFEDEFAGLSPEEARRR